MKKTFGIFAHVDAGKTTFSEQLLYQMGVTHKAGRVDDKNTVMDTNEIEKQRGITIFSGQAYFDYQGERYYFLDTPGHADFAAEAERSVSVLDYAILLISASAGVQAHTITLFHMLEVYHVPTFIFINKCDMPDIQLNLILKSIHENLTEQAFFWNESNLAQMAECIADLDDDFAELYLEDEWKEADLTDAVISLIKDRKFFPVLYGSALRNVGMDKFFEVFHKYTQTNYESKLQSSFSAISYKIQYDDRQVRWTCMKILSGKLKVRDGFSFAISNKSESSEEKINEIRFCWGKHQQTALEARAGDLIIVSGLKTPIAGSCIGMNQSIAPTYFMPALQSVVHFPSELPTTTMLSVLRQLEAEDPQLHVVYEPETEQILLSVMGKIQLEVLEQVLRDRFSIEVTFDKPNILYKETILNPVMGYGHFEPLGHYAEVNLRLEPLPRGCGITFSSECHVDLLALNWQRLIETHVFEKMHRGILTGSPLTDVKVVLVIGRSHLKHTEGGDFREATYRAIRQGLEKAQNQLLEPYYEFEITASSNYLGRILSDIQRMSGEFEAPTVQENMVNIHGFGPVSEFLEYSTELISFTKGRGSIALWSAGYRPCHNQQEIIEKIAYNKNADANNVSCSVFCSHGTSFVVNWDEAENYMHCLH